MSLPTWRSMLLLACMSCCYLVTALETEQLSDKPMAESESILIPRFRFVGNVLVARDTSQAARNNADISHGVLMGIATVLVFPIGGLIARLSKSRYTFWVHVGCQLFGLVLLLAGFGTGIWTAVIHQEVYTDPHTFFGTCIVAFFIIQPLFGILHHFGYVKNHRQTFWTHVHVWFGRIIMILAIVNTGIGINYAANAVAAEEGVGVVAGIFGVIYIGIIVWLCLKGDLRAKREEAESSEGAFDVTQMQESVSFK